MAISGLNYEYGLGHVQRYSKHYEPSCWEILEVSPTAPAEVISAAYKALAKSRHPDRGGSTEAMQRLNVAYDAAMKIKVEKV